MGDFVHRELKLLASALAGLWLSLGWQVAPAPAIIVAPANPSIGVGQTQQFTASGARAPTAAVSAGGQYTCVLLPDGTAQCVGRNQFGQLGNGTLNDSSVLVAVNGLTTATRVAAGDEFACALLGDGTVRCWGLGESGQRGDGTFGTFAPSPVAVSGLTGAVAVASGYGHACALLGDGTMRCWGENVEGQLGNGTTANPSTGPPGSSVPVAVSGITGAASITTGAYHTCVLLGDGTVRCWGRNGQGQLGDGTLTNSATPVPVAGITGVAAVSGGGSHTCALLRDGTVHCWGENVDGQLGTSTAGEVSTTPVRVGGITGAIAVTAGWQHTCALLGDGTVQCWGRNLEGQLGNGTTTSSTTPVRVVDLTGAIAVTGGWWRHSCALLSDSSVKCWGAVGADNAFGQLGNGSTTGSATPVTMTGTGVTWASSNTTVATIDATGLATGRSGGSTTITATDGSGASASTTLTVRDLVALSVVPAGTGSGTVTSSPLGITCGTDCSEPYDRGTSVTLTAAPATRSIFIGWSGCDTVADTTCTVTMNASRSVIATFDLQRFTLTVNKTGTGSGTVTSSPPGIDCGPDCTEPYTIDTVVTLTATPNVLNVFTGWSGCDTVADRTCTVTMGSARSVAAGFLGFPF